MRRPLRKGRRFFRSLPDCLPDRIAAQNAARICQTDPGGGRHHPREWFDPLIGILQGPARAGKMQGLRAVLREGADFPAAQAGGKTDRQRLLRPLWEAAGLSAAGVSSAGLP